MDFERAGEVLDAIAEEFPPEFYQELNGGIFLLPEEKLDETVEEELYVMGEYCWDQMGRYINLYYGSFAAVLEGCNDRIWEEELRGALTHEFTHHIEGLAGERTLERKDEEFMKRFL